MTRTSFLLILLHLVSLRNVQCDCDYLEEGSKLACILGTFKRSQDALGEDDGHVRFKRKASDRSISDLKRRLNAEMIKEELLPGNSTPRLSYNSSAPSFKRGPLYGDLSTSGDGRRRLGGDKLSAVRKYGRLDPFLDSGLDCNFEEDCSWTWRKDIPNGFFIASAKDDGNSGPKSDASGRDGGEVLQLPFNLVWKNFACNIKIERNMNIFYFY